MSSTAQKTANKQNASKSTGPRTERGKVRSRANALKHGMTGEGSCLPIEDAKDLDARFDRLTECLKPQDERELVLARRASLLSVRLDRGMVHEKHTLSQNVREAVAAYDEKLMADLFAIVKSFHLDPAASVWKLMQNAQGVDWLIEQWQGLRDSLTIQKNLGANEIEIAEQLQGRDPYTTSPSRIKGLAHALCGDFTSLGGDCWDSVARSQAVQAECLVELDATLALKVVRLKEHRQTLRHDDAEQSRMEAPMRAVVDLSPTGLLFRRYENATARELYKIFDYFDTKEAAALEEIYDATLESSDTSGELASFGNSPEPASVEPVAEIETETKPGVESPQILPTVPIDPPGEPPLNLTRTFRVPSRK